MLPQSDDSTQSAGTGFAPGEKTLGSGPLVPDTNVSVGTSVSKSGSTWANRLQRTTSSGRFIPEVDGLRFVAILSVLLFHIGGQVAAKSQQPITFSAFSETLFSLISSGHIGVQLFFAISGFILALPFAAYHLKDGKAVSLRAYYLRRLTRLEPPYIITLTLFFALIVLVLKVSFSELFPHFLASVFYLHNLIYADGSAINFVAWSLEVEVQFYLLAPFLALIFRVRPAILRRALVIGLMLCFVELQSFLPNVARLQLSVLGQAQFFLAGFLLADFYLTTWSQKKSNPLFWDILFFAGWPSFIYILRYPELSHWLIPFAILALYAATLQGNWGRRLLSIPAITAIGGMCYSIYLIHFQIIALIWRVSIKARAGSDFMPNFALQLILMLPIIIAISLLFYLIVEKPCMNRDWPSRLAARTGFRKIQ